MTWATAFLPAARGAALFVVAMKLPSTVLGAGDPPTREYSYRRGAIVSAESVWVAIALPVASVVDFMPLADRLGMLRIARVLEYVGDQERIAGDSSCRRDGGLRPRCA
jgi:hypothetical protein